jgi:hypothetical protein
MYLAGIPVCTIQLTGHWASDAFMDYIRPQIAKFSSLVSQSMVSNQSFFTIPTNNKKTIHHSTVDKYQKHGLLQPIMILSPIVIPQ